MAFTNGEKSKHGKNAQSNIESLLEHCKNKSYIKDYQKDFRIGKAGFSNSGQFYAPFYVSLNNSKHWLIYSTTSMRTDRIKGQQWDSLNIKLIDKSVDKVFLVYSDGIAQSEIDSFKKQNDKYLTKFEFSSIDSIISQNELYNLLEASATSSLTSGQIKDLQGRNFESLVATTLSNTDNLHKWKTNNKVSTGMHYNIFKAIVSYLNLDSSVIEKIKATSDSKVIGKLPSGGNPKTDVMMDIIFKDSTQSRVTISCKRSSDKKVSVHEYSAESFANILDSKNSSLRLLLENFQTTPSLSGFGETNIDALTKELAHYSDKLSQWVLAGIHGYGDKNKHWASHILTYDNNDNTISFHDINTYIELLKNNGGSGHFGTLFTWTYPSKKRGKSIQLKCKILK